MKTLLMFGILVIASHYHDYYEGKIMANGERFHQCNYTAAYNNAPLNSYIKIRNPHTKKIIRVKVTDRMLHRMLHNGRIDLSKSAFKSISTLKKGIARLEIIR